MKDSTSAIRIRQESPADIPAVRRVTSAAFLAAPHTSHTEEFIVDALRSAGKLTVSTVATDNDEVVGHVAISPITINGEERSWYGLGPVSVLPGYQRRGIGSALVMDALVVLSGTGAAGCVVLGDPTFYERFGFKATAALTLPGVAPEQFMTVAFDSSVPSGTVAYHDAFKAQG
ncbi:MAG TPA: N-acetyltransferase [Steroidobacteraceae bacterium]|nr:N-acetyltransferase [Steroidobacteraceae bacterium]